MAAGPLGWSGAGDASVRAPNNRQSQRKTAKVMRGVKSKAYSIAETHFSKEELVEQGIAMAMRLADAFGVPCCCVTVRYAARIQACQCGSRYCVVDWLHNPICRPGAPSDIADDML
jgi:hypothetical protein